MTMDFPSAAESHAGHEFPSYTTQTYTAIPHITLILYNALHSGTDFCKKIKPRRK